MKKEITEFEKYKVLHSIQHPDDNLKSWIDESTFNNIYTDDWENLQECFATLDNLMTDNNIFEGIDDSGMEQYEYMKEKFALSFIEGNKNHAFEWLYSLAEWYLEKLPKPTNLHDDTESYLETHYEVVCLIEDYLRQYEQLEGVIGEAGILKIYNEVGMGSKWRIAKDITDKFQSKHANTIWGEDDIDWLETLESFVENYFGNIEYNYENIGKQ